MTNNQKIVVKGIKNSAKDLFDNQVKLLNKIVKKLKVESPIITVSEVYTQQFIAYKGESYEGPIFRPVLVDVFDVTIELPQTLKFDGGWELKAIIGHLEGLVIPIDPDNDLPNDIDPLDTNCDHCGVNRYRTKSFLVQNDNGDWKKVGGSCVKKFLGVDPSSYFKLIQALHDFKHNEMIALDEDELDIDHSRKLWNPELEAVDIDKILTLSNDQVNKDGEFIKNDWKEVEYDRWTKMVRTNEGDSTSDKVKETYIKLDNTSNIIINKELVNDVYKYWSSIDVKGREHDVEYYEYENNNPILKTKKEIYYTDYEKFLLKCKSYSEHKRIRIMDISSLLSAFNSYLKYKKDLLKPKSEHIGIIGDRMNMILTVVSVKTINNDFGTSYIYNMVDENNNQIIKFGTINNRYLVKGDIIEKGSILKFNTDIKNHNVFNDVKQTIIGRVSKFQELKNKKKVSV